MNDTLEDFAAADQPPMPDAAHLQHARDYVLHAYAVELLIKRIIWWTCIGIEIVTILGAAIVLFNVESISIKLACVVVALIAHEGMTTVVIWVFLTSLRMDMLRQLKGMELQLATLRNGGRR
jgi:hypothetical protein